MSSTSSVTASGALGLYSKEAVKPSPDIAKKYSTASKVVSGIPLIGHWFSYSKHYDLGDDLIRETKLCRQIELLNLECEYSFIDIGRSLLTVALGTAGLALAFFIGPLSIAFAAAIARSN